MIGTTRSRVSFSMNRFRKLGFVEYNGRIKVYKSLLNMVLHDHVPSGLPIRMLTVDSNLTIDDFSTILDTVSAAPERPAQVRMCTRNLQSCSDHHYCR
jgi:hypothetical protein